jgi:hypothetical protein
MHSARKETTNTISQLLLPLHKNIPHGKKTTRTVKQGSCKACTEAEYTR